MNWLIRRWRERPIKCELAINFWALFFARYFWRLCFPFDGLIPGACYSHFSVIPIFLDVHFFFLSPLLPVNLNATNHIVNADKWSGITNRLLRCNSLIALKEKLKQSHTFRLSVLWKYKTKKLNSFGYFYCNNNWIGAFNFLFFSLFLLRLQTI